MMKKQFLFSSTVFRIVTMIIILVLPVNIMTLVLSSMAVENVREQISRDIQSSLQTNADTLNERMYQLSRKMTMLSYKDTDFDLLANAPENDSEDIQASLIQARQTLDQVQSEYSDIDLIYFCFQKHDYIITSGYPVVLSKDCRKLIEQNIIAHPTTPKEMLTTSLDDRHLLYMRNTWNNADFGFILDMDSTLERLNLNQMPEGRCVFFVNTDGEPVNQNATQYLSEVNKSYEDILNDTQYSVFEAQMEDCPVKLVEVVYWNDVVKHFPVTIKVVQIISIILTLLVIPVLIWCVGKWIAQPFHRLENAINHIEHGNLDYRIEEIHEGKEFERVNHSFNTMMEEIKTLKIDVYEKELEQKNIKMRYLSQQIKPHFILNALNIIYSYDENEYPLIQKMLRCVLMYFRYIARVNDDFVYLSQEMAHINDYFEIQKVRYPGNLFTMVEYAPELADAQIPPLIVQNFAENAMKYSLDTDKEISILVIADKYKDASGGQEKLRIRLADNGVGMSDELLEKVERFKATGKPQEGLGIGIQNCIERLKYLYSDEGNIRLWRDPHYQGTNVEIILPLIYKEHNDENSFSR